MTEPRHVSELLAEWVARVAALGPFLVRIEMTQPTLDRLKTLTPEVKSQVARGQALGYLSSDRVSPLAGVAVRAVSDLPPGALRLHYSDGRVVTRYRLVRDPRALQVCFRDQEYGLRANRGERHGLSLMVRFGRSWVYGDQWPGTSWKGPRLCPYVPGLARLAELAGLELTEWQQDYVARAMRAHAAGQPVQVNMPRHFGRLW